MAEKKDIGALWLNKTKNGETYMSGSIEINGETHKILVFKNNYKEKDNHPDYKILPKISKESPQVKAVRAVFEDEAPF